MELEGILILFEVVYYILGICNFILQIKRKS